MDYIIIKLNDRLLTYLNTYITLFHCIICINATIKTHIATFQQLNIIMDIYINIKTNITTLQHLHFITDAYTTIKTQIITFPHLPFIVNIAATIRTYIKTFHYFITDVCKYTMYTHMYFFHHVHLPIYFSS